MLFYIQYFLGNPNPGNPNPRVIRAAWANCSRSDLLIVRITGGKSETIITWRLVAGMKLEEPASL